jgi:hypothetical protein
MVWRGLHERANQREGGVFKVRLSDDFPEE